MNPAFLPVFQPELPDDPVRRLAPRGLRAIVRHIDELNGAAIERDVTMLTDFADNRAAPDEFDGDAAALDEIMGEWTKWFDPADALRTVAALLKELREDPAPFGGVGARDAAALKEDLEVFAAALAKAIAQGAMFRLDVVQ